MTESGSKFLRDSDRVSILDPLDSEIFGLDMVHALAITAAVCASSRVAVGYADDDHHRIVAPGRWLSCWFGGLANRR
jgi:hypothetical protein